MWTSGLSTATSLATCCSPWCLSHISTQAMCPSSNEDHWTSRWEWAGPDLALDLAPMASKPISEAMGQPKSTFYLWTLWTNGHYGSAESNLCICNHFKHHYAIDISIVGKHYYSYKSPQLKVIAATTKINSSLIINWMSLTGYRNCRLISWMLIKRVMPHQHPHHLHV